MEKKNSKSIEMIEEILQPEVLDELAMNEIKAEDDGIIEKVLVKNGQAVEFGTPLFKYRRTK